MQQHNHDDDGGLVDYLRGVKTQGHILVALWGWSAQGFRDAHEATDQAYREIKKLAPKDTKVVVIYDGDPLPTPDRPANIGTIMQQLKSIQDPDLTLIGVNYFAVPDATCHRQFALPRDLTVTVIDWAAITRSYLVPTATESDGPLLDAVIALGGGVIVQQSLELATKLGVRTIVRIDAACAKGNVHAL